MKSFVIIIVVVFLVALVVYGGYRVYRPSNNQPSFSTQSAVPHQTMQTQPTIIVANTVYKVMPSAKLGNIFTDTKGMTLYTYKKDGSGVSHCAGGCLKVWPAYVTASPSGDLPQDITVNKRTDGTLQFAWKGMPLYYFSHDKKPGDVNGEGIGTVWTVVRFK